MRYTKDGVTIDVDGRIFVSSYADAPSEIRAKIDALGGLAAVQPYTPPVIKIDDLGELNAALAMDGSIVRALCELLLDRDTKMTEAVTSATSLADLRTKFPKAVTREQFKQALVAKMR